MHSQKQRSVQSGDNKKKVMCTPSTSLPPLVEGELRGFLEVTISRVLWTVQKPPSSTFIRLRWWGESSNGTHFFPKDESQLSSKTIKTTARFPICCGPKQFTSYLSDMGSLVLDVLTKQDHLPIARAQVSAISRLSLSHPISGFYTFVSPTSEKLGELQVSLHLEPLTEAHDSSNSTTTIDLSCDGPQGAPLPLPLQRNSSPDCSSGTTPRGTGQLCVQTLKEKYKDVSSENQILINKSQNSQTALDPSGKEQCDQSSNILSVIIERGDKLRNAMMVSALKCDTHSDQHLKDIPIPLQNDNDHLLSKPPPLSRMLLQNILHSDSSLMQSENVAVVTDDSPHFPADFDQRTVDLLLGRSRPPLLDGEASFTESISSVSSINGHSAFNDPQHDEALLENLFYKTPMTNTNLQDAEEQMDFSAESQLTNSSLRAKKPQTQTGPKVDDNPVSDPQQPPVHGGIPLSEEQVNLLSSIRLAKVTIDSLTVSTTCTTTTSRKGSNNRKPPKPLTRKKCTFFVECTFPTGSASSKRSRNRTTEWEVTRAVSSKCIGGEVKFNQHSVFPAHLRKTALWQWWEAVLSFKIYIRKDDKKKPVLIGKAVYPLQCLLKTKRLSQSVPLLVQPVEGDHQTGAIGPLKVSVELAAEKTLNPEFSKRKLTWRNISPFNIAVSQEKEPSPMSKNFDIYSQSMKVPSPSNYTILEKSRQPVKENLAVLLHTLLMVPNGNNFSCGPMGASSFYLSCKLFWCDETVRSVISWGQTNPSFNFVQVTPVALTAKLLERMKNNVMVIEVWQKMGPSAQDQLLGLVKLPLHQFYISFRDPKITKLLLQAQYPVLGVDCYMPVTDVFSGSCKGSLRVVLAMGQSEQILALQHVREEKKSSCCHLVRPVNQLDHRPQVQTKMRLAHQPMIEHLFVVRVEKVTGLTPLQSTVWGEADCYVQYSFPCQEYDPAANDNANQNENSLNLKPFRTTNALYVPDPLFDHSETHLLVAPEGVPVQRLLLSSLSSQGPSSGLGVQFEVWCRYYYPNVRDQLVANGLLPLSKLCALVSTQMEHPDKSQVFSLSLVPRMDSPIGNPLQSSGLLDVSIGYRHQPVTSEEQPGRGDASRVITLVVEVRRACGLQAAARVVSERDERFMYFAEVGVNAYVTVQFSFLPETEKRSTGVAARTFCPHFDHRMELSCDLLQRSSGETCSLAEQLQNASAVFTLWNRENRKAMDTSKIKDLVLGTVNISLADLILKRTGVSGWFGVYAPQSTSSSEEQQVLVGGLELSLRFIHHSDRERLIKAGQCAGWEMAQIDCERQDHDRAWEDSMQKTNLTFLMPKAWMPVHCLLLPGHSKLQRSTYCYLRYKFYDQDAFCSSLKHPSMLGGTEDSQATVTFEGCRTIELTSSQSLTWYLQEERLEVQLWVAFKKEKTQRPSSTDRLVGSAFIDLSALTKTHKQKLTLSGLYPLFRCSATNLLGAALRVHITLTICRGPTKGPSTPTITDNKVDSDSQEEHSTEELQASYQCPLHAPPIQSQSKCQTKLSDGTPDITYLQQTEIGLDESFPVNVSVERAMHLNLKGCPQINHNEGSPCCCVSYVVANATEPVFTALVAHTNCPVWDHEQECRLSKQLLTDPQQSLVFKVWHKQEIERVIGFASVDLSPLICGFQSVCGWYNITDFSGQCHGQLKVSITPLKWVQYLRGQRKTINEESGKNRSVHPISYHTSTMYIRRYPVQTISSPDLIDRLFSQNNIGHNVKYMEKGCFYNQNLQEQTAHCSVGSSCANDISPSSSMLFSTLRMKLNELDKIQRYFSQKLSTPVFPFQSKQGCQNKPEEQIESKKGLRGQHLETILYGSQCSPTLSSVGEISPKNTSECVCSPCRTPVSSQEDPSHPEPPQTNISDSHTESEEEVDCEHSLTTAIEIDDTGEKGDGDHRSVFRNKEEIIDDEDYEEVVIKPRHLNEVTSSTDKTSPWTSILSDPHRVSLGSLDSPQPPELDISRDDGGKCWSALHAENRYIQDSSAEQDCTVREGTQQHPTTRSEAEESDTERENDRTLQASTEGNEIELSSTNGEPNHICLSTITKDHSLITHNASMYRISEASDLQLSVPNFFLPSQQLESSMRDIHVVPAIPSCVSSDTEQSHQHEGNPRRGPRQFPNMSPTSMKKETQRFAKIFSAHFDKDP